MNYTGFFFIIYFFFYVFWVFFKLILLIYSSFFIFYLLFLFQSFLNYLPSKRDVFSFIFFFFSFLSSSAFFYLYNFNIVSSSLFFLLSFSTFLYYYLTYVSKRVFIFHLNDRLKIKYELPPEFILFFSLLISSIPFIIILAIVYKNIWLGLILSFCITIQMYNNKLTSFIDLLWFSFFIFTWLGVYKDLIFIKFKHFIELGSFPFFLFSLFLVFLFFHKLIFLWLYYIYIFLFFFIYVTGFFSASIIYKFLVFRSEWIKLGYWRGYIPMSFFILFDLLAYICQGYYFYNVLYAVFESGDVQFVAISNITFWFYSLCLTISSSFFSFIYHWVFSTFYYVRRGGTSPHLEDLFISFIFIFLSPFLCTIFFHISILLMTRRTTRSFEFNGSFKSSTNNYSKSSDESGPSDNDNSTTPFWYTVPLLRKKRISYHINRTKVDTLPRSGCSLIYIEGDRYPTIVADLYSDGKFLLVSRNPLDHFRNSSYRLSYNSPNMDIFVYDHYGGAFKQIFHSKDSCQTPWTCVYHKWSPVPLKEVFDGKPQTLGDKVRLINYELNFFPHPLYTDNKAIRERNRLESKLPKFVRHVFNNGDMDEAESVLLGNGRYASFLVFIKSKGHNEAIQNKPSHYGVKDWLKECQEICPNIKTDSIEVNFLGIDEICSHDSCGFNQFVDNIFDFTKKTLPTIYPILGSYYFEDMRFGPHEEYDLREATTFSVDYLRFAENQFNVLHDISLRFLGRKLALRRFLRFTKHSHCQSNLNYEQFLSSSHKFGKLHHIFPLMHDQLCDCPEGLPSHNLFTGLPFKKDIVVSEVVEEIGYGLDECPFESNLDEVDREEVDFYLDYERKSYFNDLISLRKELERNKDSTPPVSE